MKIEIKKFKRNELTSNYLVRFLNGKSDFKLNYTTGFDIRCCDVDIVNRIEKLGIPSSSSIISCAIISEIDFIPELNTELFGQYKEFMESIFGAKNLPINFSMSKENKHYFISVLIPEYEGKLACSLIFSSAGNAWHFNDRLESFFIKNIQTEFKVPVRDVPEGNTKVDVIREKTIEEIHDENADYVYRMLIENKFDDEENIKEDEPNGFNFDNVELPEENNDVVFQNKEPDADGFNFDKYEDEEYRGDEGFDELDEPDNSKQYEEINIQIPEQKKSKKEIALKVLDTTYKIIFIATVLRKLIKGK
ncbi:hypothetical protein JK182_01205 [Acetobacter okinawensis]|uniref:hypothetical protein n=1 Tax=Acetobacter okinawensis TaxID=1076594 RepID=UPI001BAE1042|nr:hypothetical protein [Acetobacter okinawensis]MBS0987309.1 hypothetical protein [Acetobacter okinawensis]